MTIHLVRLKGADRYVLGRGGEDVTALLAADVPFDVTRDLDLCPHLTTVLA